MNLIAKKLLLLIVLALLQACDFSSESEPELELEAGQGQAEIQCASHAEASGQYDGQDCIYPLDFSSSEAPVVDDIYFTSLPNEGTHILQSALVIGKNCLSNTECQALDNQPTITIEAGSTLAFTDGYVLVNRGATILAEGTLSAPITFLPARQIANIADKVTMASGAKWLGVAINGKAPADGCEEALNDCHLETNGFVSHYGGNQEQDSSGVLSFVRIFDVDSSSGASDDYPSLQLSGVGSGTTIDYVHIHRGWDDGVALFGGKVNLSHIVVTHAQDDGFDIDHNWSGKAEFLYVLHGSYVLDFDDGQFDVNAGHYGIEYDGRMRSISEKPSSIPYISNVTIVTSGLPNTVDEDVSTAIAFDDYAVAEFHNILMLSGNIDTAGHCIEFKADGEVFADEITFSGSAMSCLEAFYQNSFGVQAPQQIQTLGKQQWFENGGENVIHTRPSDERDFDGFSTNMDSSQLPVPSSMGSAMYIGGVANTEMESQWYQWVKTAMDLALPLSGNK